MDRYDVNNEIGIFNWKHLKDHRLYTDNFYAIKVLKEGINLSQDDLGHVETNDEKLIFHCYWYGLIGRKQVLSISSFLCTQNLENSKLVLWLDKYDGFDNYEENGLLKDILPFIEVRSYDPAVEILDTPWELHPRIPGVSSNLIQRGDAFRFLILYKYGGVFFDLDVMFLKELGGLVNKEFCYAWEQQPYANSAVFHLNAKSPTAEYLLHKAIIKRVASPWQIFLYSDLALSDLMVYPCAFFDPIWQETCKDFPILSFSDFFKPFDNEFTNKFSIQSYKEFFSGCYGYHWHNQWDTMETENSFFGLFEKEFKKLIADKNRGLSQKLK